MIMTLGLCNCVRFSLFISAAVSVCCLIFPLPLVDAAANVNPKKVEIKTEAPPEIRAESPKACYEYLHGRLHARYNHGDTWQNGVKDACTNCTCDNGGIRCFFHFCKGPSTGYMTPPSTDSMRSPSSSSQKPFVETLPEEEEEEEGSALRPIDLEYIDEDSEDDSGEYEYDLNRKEPQWPVKKWSASSRGKLKEVSEPRDEMRRRENETHQLMKSYYCGEKCDKVCKHGFKVNPLTGCLKCRCYKCGPPPTCSNKCANGYVYDSFNCQTCICRVPDHTEDSEDIVFVTNEHRASSDKVSTHTSIPPHQSHFSNHIPNIEKEWTFSAPPEELYRRTTDRPPPSTRRDFFDGVYNVVAPKGNKDDRISEKEIDEQLWKHISTADSDFSKFPQREDEFSSSLYFNADHRDEATVKSVAKTKNSELLLLILIPIAVLLSLGTLVILVLWRKFHRDKYDINNFRPSRDERERLRPVTIMAEEQTASLGRHQHV